MHEASKAAIRRAKSQLSNYWRNKVFIGHGVDIGCGDDPCNRMVDWNITELSKFDFEQGDANYIRHHFAYESLDFVHSSHSLEHMSRHPWDCIIDWCSLLKVGGHLVLTVPDFEMYEKLTWPSRYNSDHKWAFYTHRMDNHSFILDFNEISAVLESCGMKVIYIERLTDGWNPNDQSDQTISFENGIECAWEVLAVKEESKFVKSKLSISRFNALGDTIAVAPFYNEMSKHHDVTFVTNPDYIEFHQKVNAVSSYSPVDVDLNGYDRNNPYIPIYELGFRKCRIPVPSKLDFTILNSTIASLEDYIVVDRTDIWLKSRRVSFNIPEKLSSKYKIIELNGRMSNSDLINLIGKAKLVIGRDSAPIHIAQALGTPFIAIMSSVMFASRYVNGIGISNTCPHGNQYCYHKVWDTSDCPSHEYVAPCGVIDDKLLGEAIEMLIN